MIRVILCIAAGCAAAVFLAGVGCAITVIVQAICWAGRRWQQRGARRAHAGLRDAIARAAELERKERLELVTAATRLRDCVPGWECGVWDPRGDRPVAVFCRNHCPSCASGLRPCAVHDQDMWAEIERQAMR